jgi:hypothetical protein
MYVFTCIMFPFAGIFLKIHTCNIVPICYKCWKFSFDGSKFKGTLYVDQCTFLLVSWLPLEGFHSIHTWNNMGFHWILFNIGCDHSKIKGILHGDQCISTTLEGFTWQYISVTRHIFHTNFVSLVSFGQYQRTLCMKTHVCFLPLYLFPLGGFVWIFISRTLHAFLTMLRVLLWSFNN